MASHLFQVIFESQTGMPEDVFVNTFHFDLLLIGDPSLVTPRIIDFYSDTQSTGFAVADFMGDEITGAATIKVYNDTTAPPHEPILVEPWTLPALSASGNFPQEVCTVVSFKADPVPGVDIRSTRGRIFIGPLNVAAADGFTTGPPQNWSNPVRPRSALTDTFAEAAGDLLAANDASGVWGIWSRKESDFYPIVEGFVDNAFDTQRRRGVAASARSTF